MFYKILIFKIKHLKLKLGRGYFIKCLNHCSIEIKKGGEGNTQIWTLTSKVSLYLLKGFVFKTRLYEIPVQN